MKRTIPLALVATWIQRAHDAYSFKENDGAERALDVLKVGIYQYLYGPDAPLGYLLDEADQCVADLVPISQEGA